MGRAFEVDCGVIFSVWRYLEGRYGGRCMTSFVKRGPRDRNRSTMSSSGSHLLYWNKNIRCRFVLHMRREALKMQKKVRGNELNADCSQATDRKDRKCSQVPIDPVISCPAAGSRAMSRPISLDHSPFPLAVHSSSNCSPAPRTKRWKCSKLLMLCNADQFLNHNSRSE